MKLISYTSHEELIAAVADQVSGALAAALQRQDQATLAVPGGTTPGPVFDLLSTRDLPWDRVRVMLTDERWVPEDHERSNAGLLRRRLLVGRAQAAQFLPFYAAGEAEAQMAARAAEIDAHLPLTVAVLGMGADMHTASLFPSAPGLAAALADDAPALVALHPADQPDTRVSLSARVLNGAAAKHLVIFGVEKRAALEQAQGLPAENAPIRAVMDDLTVHWAE